MLCLILYYIQYTFIMQKASRGTTYDSKCISSGFDWHLKDGTAWGTECPDTMHPLLMPNLCDYSVKL